MAKVVIRVNIGFIRGEGPAGEVEGIYKETAPLPRPWTSFVITLRGRGGGKARGRWRLSRSAGHAFRNSNGFRQ